MVPAVLMWAILAAGVGQEPDSQFDEAKRRDELYRDIVDDLDSKDKVFTSAKEMKPKDKKQKKSEWYHLNRLKNKIKKMLQCKQCGGTGKVERLVPAGGKQRRDVGRYETQACGRCGGRGGEEPPDLYDALTQYLSRRALYERRYPFAAPVNLGVETMVIKRVNTPESMALYNLMATLQYRGIVELRPGSAVILTLFVVDVDRRDRERPHIHGLAPVDRLSGDVLNVRAQFAESIPAEVERDLAVIILGTYDGREKYETLQGVTKERMIVRVHLAKRATGMRLPWH